MVGIFRQRNSANIIMLLVLSSLLQWRTLLFAAPAATYANDGYLYKFLIKILSPLAVVLPGVYNWLAFIIILIIAVLLAQFISIQKLMQRPNFLPAMCWVMLASLVPQLGRLSAPLVAALFLLLAFMQLMRQPLHKKNIVPVYTAGLCLGMASMFFFPAVLFLFFGLIALSVLHSFSLREWLLLITAFAVPYYVAAACMFLGSGIRLQALFPAISPGLPGGDHSMWLTGALCLVLIPLFAGLYYVNRHAIRMLIHVRRGWLVMGFYIVFGIILLFFNAGMENFLLLFVPVAAFQAYGYYYAEWKPFALVCFWLTIVFIACFQLFGR